MKLVWCDNRVIKMQESVHVNYVWDLEDVSHNFKPIACKWILKTKIDSRGNVEYFKARLLPKGFIQREGIDFNGTF